MDQETYYQQLPRKRMAAGAILLNQQAELLIVQPTYRHGWLIPGGSIDEYESPRAACRREIAEELSLTLTPQRLLCVEYQLYERQGGQWENVQFIFYGGRLTEAQQNKIRLPPEELKDYRFLPLAEAIHLLQPRLGRRVKHAMVALEQHRIVYLENGQILS